MQSCRRDEGRPLGAGDQEQASNHCELLPLRAVVVSVAGKGGTQLQSGEIRRDDRKRTADDVPKFTGRCRNRGISGPWDEFGRSPEARPERATGLRRREPGSVSFVERGNLPPRCQGKTRRTCGWRAPSGTTCGRKRAACPLAFADASPEAQLFACLPAALMPRGP